jgi:hypothetical protein
VGDLGHRENQRINRRRRSRPPSRDVEEYEDLFIATPATIAAIGGLVGALTGTITWLIRRLLKMKDEQLADLKKACAQAEEALVKDRDYWRSITMKRLE